MTDLSTVLSFIIGFDAIGIYLLVFITWVFVRNNFKNRVLDYFICILIAIALSEGLKTFINHPRPLETLLDIKFEGSSFPSTHTSVSYASAFFYIFNSINFKLLKKRSSTKKVMASEIKFSREEFVTIVLISVLAINVSMLRVVVGAHFIKDVIAGVVVGAIAAFTVKNYDIDAKRIKLPAFR